MTEREKMLAGGWFDPRDAELTAIRDNATRLMHRLNVELCGHDDAYRAALRELCPGCEGFIREPFRCDYGQNGQKWPFVRKNSGVSDPVLRTKSPKSRLCP